MRLNKLQRNAIEEVKKTAKKGVSQMVLFTNLFPEGKMRKNVNATFRNNLKKAVEKNGRRIYFNSYRDFSIYLTVPNTKHILYGDGIAMDF